MIGRFAEYSDRTVEDMEDTYIARFAMRIMAGITHPECPVPIIPLDASRLSRFLARHVITKKEGRGIELVDG